jgi:FKBP-type peptidyl-prolyl cis-trans isomerase FkpA
MIQVPGSRMRHVLILSLAVLATGCGGGDSNPTAPILPGAPFSQTDSRVGTGADATAGRRVTVNYTGWLYDPTRPEQKGQQFDTSVGRPPFAFTLGAGQVIRGWDQGVAGMKVGGQRRLVIPPDLAYGSMGAGGVIPPNATLVFDIELLDVQ